MTNSGIPLPLDEKLDPTPLVTSMRRTTNSYKHLFLRSILNLVAEGQSTISFEDLFREMLAEAWWPAFHYRLSLGKQDKVVRRLEADIKSPDELRLRPADVRDYLKRLPFDVRKETSTGLLRYVPQRLIAPWFADEIAVLPDSKRDAAIKSLASENFDTIKPLYQIEPEAITIHPDWVESIRSYSSIFFGWADAAWLSYLESKNPHATSLLAKIKPAFDRSSLTNERRIWMSATFLDLKCIYTNQVFDPNLFAIDHFLPHAFTGHDRFWNLTPIAPALNMAKSDRLPPNGFVPALARQHALLWRSRKKLPSLEQSQLLRTRDDYAADLGIADPEQASDEEMTAAYEATYSPLFGIANRMGFPSWTIPKT